MAGSISDIAANVGFTAFKDKKPTEYPWDKCIQDMTTSHKTDDGKPAKTYDVETARKICGTIRARTHGFKQYGSGEKAKEMAGLPGGIPIFCEPGDFFIPDGFDLLRAIKEIQGDFLAEDERRMIDAETKVYKGAGTEIFCPVCGKPVAEHESEEKEVSGVPSGMMLGGPGGLMNSMGLGATSCPACGKMCAVNTKACPYCGMKFGKKAASLCKTPKFKQCVEHVMNPDARADGTRPVGKPEGSAYAICYSVLGTANESKKEILPPDHYLRNGTWEKTLKAVGVFYPGPNQAALSNMPPMREALTPELQEKVRRVWQSVNANNLTRQDGVVTEVLPNEAIVSFGNDDIWSYPFIINENNEVIFDRPVRVRMAYVPYEGGAAVPPVVSQVAEKEEETLKHNGHGDQRTHSAKFPGKAAPEDDDPGLPPKVDKRNRTPLNDFIKGCVRSKQVMDA